MRTTPEDRARILKLAGEVRGGDWGQIWEDPGDYPSNAGSRALASQFQRSDAPDELASWVEDLLADFDALATQRSDPKRPSPTDRVMVEAVRQASETMGVFREAMKVDLSKYDSNEGER